MLLLTIAGAAVVMLSRYSRHRPSRLLEGLCRGHVASCYYRFTCALRLLPMRHAQMHQPVLHHDIHLYSYLRQKLLEERRNHSRAECLAGKTWS